MAEIDLAAFDRIERLGSGGLGDVYRATRRSTSGDVAIKVLRDWSDRDVAWQRTQRELRALVDLRGHANVVNVEEVIETAGTMAIVMEFAPGGSVLDLLEQRGGRLSLPETLLVAEHTATALAAAHELGIIHRDIKPHNLLIGSFGQVKVCDFGIASLTRSEAVHDRTSSLSIRYASPEELRGEQTVGPPTDVYSLAATLHQLLTGQHLPQPDGTAGSLPLRSWHASDEVPSDVEVEFRSLVVRAADRNPTKRPTAIELRDTFEGLAGRLGATRVRALPLIAGGGGSMANAQKPTTGPPSNVPPASVPPTSVTVPAVGLPTDPPAASATGKLADTSAIEPNDSSIDATVVGAVSSPEAHPTTAFTPAAAGAMPNDGTQTTAMRTSGLPPRPPERERTGRTALIAFVVLAVLLGGTVVVFGSGLFLDDNDEAGATGQETATIATTPTIAAVTTVAPVTVAPTTAAPTTVAPSTAASTTAATTTTTTTTTATTPPPTTLVVTTPVPTTVPALVIPERYNGRKCPGDGPCIEIDSISLIDGEYWIGWRANFVPDTGGVHAHFFWDIYEPAQVGSASPNRAPWELTASQSFVPTGEMSIANRPADATGICVSPADGAHAVIDPNYYHCAFVEAGDFGGASPVDLFEIEDFPASG